MSAARIRQPVEPLIEKVLLDIKGEAAKLFNIPSVGSADMFLLEQVDAPQPRLDRSINLLHRFTLHCQPLFNSRAATRCGVIAHDGSQPAHRMRDEWEDSLAGEIETLYEGCHDHGSSNVPDRASHVRHLQDVERLRLKQSG